jgi:hypothetical protein
MNYGQIQTAVRGYIHRDDPATDGNLANAVTFAQNWIQQQFAPTAANTLGTLAFVAGTAGPWAQAPLPALFQRFVLIQPTGEPALDYIDPRSFIERLAGAGIGDAFTIAGALVLADAKWAGSALLTNVILQPTALVADGDSNYLSADFPDALIWAAVAEQHRFVQDWDEGERAQQHALALVQSYNAAHTAKQQSGGRLIIRS